MPMSRRDFLAATTAAATIPSASAAVPAAQAVAPMYGLIGKMNATPGKRDALAGILLEGLSGMPGCLSYIVAHDPSDADALWITEVWDSKASHAASLSLPSVREAIKRGRPMIAGFGERFETSPIGGHGLRVTAS